MSTAAWLQLLLLIALLAISTPLLGAYLAKVYGGGHAPGDRIFGPIERLVYRLCGVDETKEQRWPTYAISLLAFSFVSVLILYAQLRLQNHLPMNPDGLQYGKGGATFYGKNLQDLGHTREGLVSMYSGYGQEEDKAETFGWMMTPDYAARLDLFAMTDPHLAAKVKHMREQLRRYSQHSQPTGQEVQEASMAR